MTSLASLYASNPDNYVLNRYMNCSKESYSLGKFWLGGQLQLSIHEPITDQHLAQVISINNDPKFSPANSWEAASISRANAQFSEFMDVYYSHLKNV